MKRKMFAAAVTLTLAGSLTMTSCIGSFGLTGQVFNWNKSIGNKWINEVVFLALNIVPVYSITLFVDVVVLNSIEFWTGDNPMAVGKVQKVNGTNGEVTITTTENGYNLSNEKGQETSLIFDRQNSTWNYSVNGGEAQKLIQINGETATVYLSNGATQQVELSQAGVLAFRQTVEATQLALNK